MNFVSLPALAAFRSPILVATDCVFDVYISTAVSYFFFEQVVFFWFILFLFLFYSSLLYTLLSSSIFLSSLSIFLDIMVVNTHQQCVYLSR